MMENTSSSSRRGLSLRGAGALLPTTCGQDGGDGVDGGCGDRCTSTSTACSSSLTGDNVKRRCTEYRIKLVKALRGASVEYLPEEGIKILVDVDHDGLVSKRMKPDIFTTAETGIKSSTTEDDTPIKKIDHVVYDEVDPVSLRAGNVITYLNGIRMDSVEKFHDLLDKLIVEHELSCEQEQLQLLCSRSSTPAPVITCAEDFGMTTSVADSGYVAGEIRGVNVTAHHRGKGKGCGTSSKGKKGFFGRSRDINQFHQNFRKEGKGMNFDASRLQHNTTIGAMEFNELD
ncbi:unnamed protein product, partial [Amoebophrya sp. A25]|eukprot:GSA25T00026249001.1